MSDNTLLTAADVCQALDLTASSLGIDGTTLSLPFSRVIVDSRQAVGGELFIALPGERCDGHEYVVAAMVAGARGAMVRASKIDECRASLGRFASAPLFAVPDTLAGLQQLAAYWRRRFSLPVVAVTGSVGKTTTKEFVASVLARRLSVHRSEGNRNNEIGLPLSLLQLNARHQAMVLEMGTYGPGDIRQLCAVACPTIGIVTGVSWVHLERMGSLEVIAAAKAELVEALPRTGTAILNADDARVRAMAAMTAARVVYYGLSPQAAVRGSDVQPEGLRGVRFTMHLNGEARPIHLLTPGRHQVINALAAAAVARELGMSVDEIVEGLEALHLEARLVTLPGVAGSLILDDTYNASPVSVLASLDLLGDLEGRRIAVLGDMRELGSFEDEGHRLIGERAARTCDLLAVVGEKAALAGAAAVQAGMDPSTVFFALNNARAIDWLKPRLAPGDHVLVKGSRSMRLEEVVRAVAAASGEAMQP